MTTQILAVHLPKQHMTGPRPASKPATKGLAPASPLVQGVARGAGGTLGVAVAGLAAFGMFKEIAKTPGAEIHAAIAAIGLGGLLAAGLGLAGAWAGAQIVD